MACFQFGKRSEDNLRGVHSDLVAVVRRALQLSAVDFTVIEGVRSKERQAILYDRGATKTLNSRHLTGHAVDLLPVVPEPWKNTPAFREVKRAMLAAAGDLGIPLRCGADWNGDGIENEKFVDRPHFELPIAKYP